MRVMCMYLPQYHTFPENDAWWGEGYTEWTAVKRALPLFKGHEQPRVPADGVYYDLKSQGVETLLKQAELAKQYGIYGFAFYQYYFCGKTLMDTPLLTLLAHPEIDIHYNLCWANESWTRTWYGLANQVLMEQTYGTEADWRALFDYLLPFFRDERYIKIDNKPIYQIYRTFDIEEFPQMVACFNKWAQQEGFSGVYIISGKTAAMEDSRKECIDGYYYFEPGYSLKHGIGSVHKWEYNISVLLRSMVNKILPENKRILERIIPAEWIYNAIEKRTYEKNECPGLIPDWDNTPRRSYKGLVYKGTNPQRFCSVLKTLSKKVAEHTPDFVYINAWNEWGEGAYLEPDKYRGCEYLEAVGKAVNEES